MEEHADNVPQENGPTEHFLSAKVAKPATTIIHKTQAALRAHLVAIAKSMALIHHQHALHAYQESLVELLVQTIGPCALIVH